MAKKHSGRHSFTLGPYDCGISSLVEPNGWIFEILWYLFWVKFSIPALNWKSRCIIIVRISHKTALVSGSLYCNLNSMLIDCQTRNWIAVFLPRMKPTRFCPEVMEQSTSSLFYLISPAACTERTNNWSDDLFPSSKRKNCLGNRFLRIALFHIHLIYSFNLGYFCFKLGDESERGSILTPDGQATLLRAKSLLTALVKSISDASTTVVILGLLHKYKDRFLQLLEADSSTHCNLAAEETERSLNERIREIQEFQELKTKVSSFICMCEIIPPGKNKAYKRIDWPTDKMWSCWRTSRNVLLLLQIAIFPQSC